jgi:hypothetical protein
MYFPNLKSIKGQPGKKHFDVKGFSIVLSIHFVHMLEPLHYKQYFNELMHF